MIIEVEVRKNTENELVGNTINFPGIVCSSGETEPELRKNIVDAIDLLM